jgi:superfamily II DNA/RNA helicase
VSILSPSNSDAPARFSDLGVSAPLVAALERQGFTTAFPIQEATLPDCLAGRDVCGEAPTGSGKTLAFALAILSRLPAEPRGDRRNRRPPTALVLIPTRELAAQIEEVIAPLAAAIGARVTSIYGGVAYGKQLSALRNGVDVVIACPGRLCDLVERGSVDLSHVEVVVIDEADRMADMGFLPAVRGLIDMTSPSRQTLLFSATLEGPVDRLIRDYQRNPVRHDVESGEADQAVVHHHFWRVEGTGRVDVTAEAISARGPAVVFCRTKRGADRLSDRLSRSGLRSAAIHSNRTQGQRERALTLFRDGRLDVLVATDIASRGIHIDAVPLVLHYDPPTDHTNYLHRSGRTGRAGSDGNVVTLVGHEHVAATKLIQRKLGLSGAISQPDVLGLVVVNPGTRRPRPAQPRPVDKRTTPAAMERPASGPRRRDGASPTSPFRERSNRRANPQGHRPTDRSRG